MSTLAQRMRIEDQQRLLLRIIAAECGCHVTELSEPLVAAVGYALVECHQRGGDDRDAHNSQSDAATAPPPPEYPKK